MGIKIYKIGYKIIAYDIIPMVEFAVFCDDCKQHLKREYLPEVEVKLMGNYPYQCNYCERNYPIFKDEQSFAELVKVNA